jgi:hypothetical protein
LCDSIDEWTTARDNESIGKADRRDADLAHGCWRAATVPEAFACDLLLFFATTTEKEQLRAAALRMGFTFDRDKHPNLGRYYRLGQIGDFRVIAVQTEMGPLKYQGSASQGIYFKSATGATAIVQLGMAFGIDPAQQSYGEVRDADRRFCPRWGCDSQPSSHPVSEFVSSRRRHGRLSSATTSAADGIRKGEDLPSPVSR